MPNPLGNVRYVAPGEPAPDPADWEFRKTSKKGNRVYVRRPISTEMLRAMVADALRQLKPEVREIVVKVADRPAVKMNGKVHERFAEILDLAAQRMEILMVGPGGLRQESSGRADCQGSRAPVRFNFLLGRNERGADHWAPDSNRGRWPV